MYNYSNNGVTVASIMDARRATPENLYPVKIRVTYKRVRKYYSTGKALSIEDWEKLPETKSKSLISMRMDIQNSFEKIKTVIQELEYEGGFSFDALNARLCKTVSDTVNTAFKIKVQTLLDNDQVGSSLYYKDALKSIENFAGIRILFENITVDWLQKYEKYLLNNDRSYTTIGMYCRAIRCIMNE